MRDVFRQSQLAQLSSGNTLPAHPTDPFAAFQALGDKQAKIRDSQALFWAESKGTTKFKLISDRPWSTVYTALNKDKEHYLKIFRDEAHFHPNFLATLSASAPENVPYLAAYNRPNNYALFCNSAGVSTDLMSRTRLRGDTLSTYGAIQSRMYARKTVLGDLRRHDPLRGLNDCIQFCKLGARGLKSTIHPGNPFIFLGAAKSKAVLDFLEAAKPLLLELFCNTATDLWTINHTDLNSSNVARLNTGKICIFDWDGALYGPPGWSLHHWFDGTFQIWSLCNHSSQKNVTVEKAAERDLNLYIAALCRDGKMDPLSLRSILPGSAVAGVLDYVVSMAPFALGSQTESAAVARFVYRRMLDLAKTVYSIASSQGKETAELGEALSTLQLDKLGFNILQNARRRRSCYLPLAADPQDEENCFPVAEIGRSPKTVKERRDQIEYAAAIFRRHGAVMLNDVIQVPLLKDAYAQLAEREAKLKSDIATGNALKVGQKRYMFTIEMTGVFASPELYRNDIIMDVLSSILGPKHILGSMTAVVSLPGSAPQHMHRDNAALFEKHNDAVGESYSVALMIPLVPLTKENGATTIVKGSHFTPNVNVSKVKSQVTNVPLGSVYLMDARLLHSGMANKSNRSRPILSLVYQRSWYRDDQNFQGQPPLILGRDFREKMTKRDDNLLGWAIPNG